MVRIHVGFTDCRGESEVGVLVPGSATSQPPGLLSSVVFGLPTLVFALGSPAEFNGLGITFCAGFKQSGTASATATASIHETERNRPFT
ncbi:MAG: hypothetical protein J07HQW1_02448 [Haloquadratum walsbyi J07HQW1]|uniref:Uncharacterized protein n=1 Tax=Haloquadratum walsbyi J07HQW1 TaxID=1238424 RepID=U1N6X7_9EURY|nr:MAG: hypothetical protein J07HQW1_02448 [Haloquadratum walsbyi J07HQW1]